MYVCVMCACVCTCMCRCRHLVYQASSIDFYFIPLRQGLLLHLNSSFSSQNGCQQASATFLSLTPMVLGFHAEGNSWIPHGIWGSEFKSSCLHKHCDPVIPPPSSLFRSPFIVMFKHSVVQKVHLSPTVLSWIQHAHTVSWFCLIN